MQLTRPTKRRAQDPTIALINVVFLMLIFFLIAGSITAGSDGDIELIQTSEAERARPPSGPVGITETGEIRYDGEALAEEALYARLAQTAAAPLPGQDAEASQAGEPVALVVDRALPAKDLIVFLRSLREAGFTARIVTRSGGSL